MKKILAFTFVSIFLFACKPGNKEQKITAYYDFSMLDIISKFKEKQLNSKFILKEVIQENKREKKNISQVVLLNDIETFTEFDLNKAAWKNSYKEIKYEAYTRFVGLENKLPIKYIDVYGDLKNPSRIYIYFLNTNNLYTSSKVINWDLAKSYSIYSIQDVKGMDADTLYIHSTW